MHGALRNSLVVGVATAVISTVLGICGARALTRYDFWGKPGIGGLIMLPLVLPEIIVAISLLVVLLQLGFQLSLFSVTLGHILMTVPFSIAVLTSSFEGFDRSLEDASRDLGEGAAATFFRVTLPIVAPGILSSLLITFTISLDEFIVAFFLSGTDPTLPIYIWSQLRFTARLPSVLALGSLLLFASFLLLWAAEVLRRRAKRKAGAGGGIL
jgi:spermidine/putrescine transport system permease protein